MILITGASSGIGEAVARRLAAGGARLVLAARREERLKSLCAAIDPSGERTLAVAADIDADADRRRLVEAVLTRFGRLDALVNNAGFGTRGAIESVPLDLVRRNYETNVFSLIGLTQLALPLLRERAPGAAGARIVNIGSVAGRIARPMSGVYDSTKHAVEAVTDALRGELKPWGIDVILIRPGFILTEFVETADRASESVEREAGLYRPYYAGYRGGNARLRHFAGVPDDIARLVEKALTARRPRTHYAGPTHARLFLLVKWLLPVRAVDWLVRMKRDA